MRDSSQATLSDIEFHQFRQLIHDIAGIHLSDAKKPLVAGRLNKRLRSLGMATYGEYFRLVGKDKTELQTCVDLLTTNETYFFREPKHFDFLREKVLPTWDRRQPLRLWSGACSSGEEPYTLAMILAEGLGERPWEILASDLSTRVLATARKGQYPLTEAEGIPPALLRRHCFKGVGENEGTFLVDPRLASRISFRQINLNNSLPELGTFDIIFLRNVMIYFDIPTKRQVVERLVRTLRPGGYFFISHSESLNGVTDALKMVSPSIYQRPV